MKTKEDSLRNIFLNRTQMKEEGRLMKQHFPEADSKDSVFCPGDLLIALDF